MRRAISFFLAVGLASGGAASLYAQAMNENTVRIVFVSRSDLNNNSGKILPTITRGMQTSAQEELNANAELKGYLQKRNVELGNVVKIDTARNGDKIVYVK